MRSVLQERNWTSVQYEALKPLLALAVARACTPAVYTLSQHDWDGSPTRVGPWSAPEDTHLREQVQSPAGSGKLGLLGSDPKRSDPSAAP